MKANHNVCKCIVTSSSESELRSNRIVPRIAYFTLAAVCSWPESCDDGIEIRFHHNEVIHASQ